MKKLLLIIILSLNFYSCTKDCSAERTEIFEYYQDLIDKARNNPTQQNSLRDSRDKKLAELKC